MAERDERGGSGGGSPSGATPGSGLRTAGRGRSDPAPVIGRLQEHGRAPYQFRSNQEESYFIKVLTDRGVKTLWGKDLERAVTAAATQPKIGDVVGVQRLGRDAVTITQKQRNAEGQVISQTEHRAHRNHWRVEKIKFFVDRAKLARQVRDAQADVREAVRAQPELKSTFLTVRAATEFAAQRIANPKDRERFVELVRESIAGSIKKGEPLPDVKLRDGVATTADKPVRGRERSDEEPSR